MMGIKRTFKPRVSNASRNPRSYPIHAAISTKPTPITAAAARVQRLHFKTLARNQSTPSPARIKQGTTNQRGYAESASSFATIQVIRSIWRRESHSASQMDASFAACAPAALPATLWVMQSSGSAKPRFDLIGVGSPIMDLLAPIPEAFLKRVAGDKGGMLLVNQEEMQEIIRMLPSAPAQSTGGSAANVIFNASRLGLRTTFLGKLGNDDVARRYRSEFEVAGVDASRFKHGEQANARCLAMVTPDAQRTLRTDLGAAMTLSPEEVRRSDFAGCRHAHIEGYLAFNRALAESALAAAREAGATVSFDLSSFEVVGATRDWLFSQFRRGIDVVFANEDEIRALFPSRATASYGDLARELGAFGVLAAVKVGADGAWLAQNGSIERITPVHVHDVVDTNGAGDAWAAGFLYGYLHRWPLQKSGALASHLGAETVRHMGPIIPSAHWERVQARGLSAAQPSVPPG